MIQIGTVGQWGKSPGDTVLLTQSVLPQRTGHFQAFCHREQATFCWSEWSPERLLSAFILGLEI